MDKLLWLLLLLRLLRWSLPYILGVLGAGLVIGYIHPFSIYVSLRSRDNPLCSYDELPVAAYDSSFHTRDDFMRLLTINVLFFERN